MCLAKEAEASDTRHDFQSNKVYKANVVRDVCIPAKCSPFSRFICRSCCRELSAATFRSPWMFRKSVSVDDKLVSWPLLTVPAVLALLEAAAAAAAANVE